MAQMMPVQLQGSGVPGFPGLRPGQMVPSVPSPRGQPGFPQPMLVNMMGGRPRTDLRHQTWRKSLGNRVMKLWVTDVQNSELRVAWSFWAQVVTDKVQKSNTDFKNKLREMTNRIEQEVDRLGSDLQEERAFRKEQDASILERVSIMAADSARDLAETQKSGGEQRRSLQERVRYLESAIADHADKLARDLADELAGRQELSAYVLEHGRYLKNLQDASEKYQRDIEEERTLRRTDAQTFLKQLEEASQNWADKRATDMTSMLKSNSDYQNSINERLSYIEQTIDDTTDKRIHIMNQEKVREAEAKLHKVQSSLPGDEDEEATLGPTSPPPSLGRGAYMTPGGLAPTGLAYYPSGPGQGGMAAPQLPMVGPGGMPRPPAGLPYGYGPPPGAQLRSPTPPGRGPPRAGSSQLLQ